MLRASFYCCNRSVVSGSAVHDHESSSRVRKQLDAQATLSLNYLVCKSRHNASAWGETKPALSIAFSVADAQEVMSEHESINPVTDTGTVGGAQCSVVDGFALLRSLSLEAGQTTANVCRYTMTVGSRTVDLPHLAFLGAWVSPGETEVNQNIETFLCGEVGLDDQCSVCAEQIKISLVLA